MGLQYECLKISASAGRNVGPTLGLPTEELLGRLDKEPTKCCHCIEIFDLNFVALLVTYSGLRNVGSMLGRPLSYHLLSHREKKRKKILGHCWGLRTFYWAVMKNCQKDV